MDWKERLQQNLVDYQSIPFWSWNDKLEPEELRRQIRAMKKAGIGGFFMHARGGLMTEYLGEGRREGRLHRRGEKTRHARLVLR